MKAILHDVKEHIEQLINKHGIKVVYADFNEYDTETEEATIAIITDEVTYFDALHELGHAVNKHRPMSNADVIKCEEEAWRWALSNSIIGPSMIVQKRIEACLRDIRGLYGN